MFLSLEMPSWLYSLLCLPPLYQLVEFQKCIVFIPAILPASILFALYNIFATRSIHFQFTCVQYLIYTVSVTTAVVTLTACIILEYQHVDDSLNNG